MESRNVSSKNWSIALFLAIFLGYLGVHRFYVGKIATGILWFLTVGLFGIGYVVDLIVIANFKFKDSYGKTLK